MLGCRDGAARFFEESLEAALLLGVGFRAGGRFGAVRAGVGAVGLVAVGEGHGQPASPADRAMVAQSWPSALTVRRIWAAASSRNSFCTSGSWS